MPDATHDTVTDGDTTHVVDTFLYALRDGDLDAASALLSEDLIYENVGFPVIYGRKATMRVFTRMAGRVGFDVAIHRSAGDGTVVLNERTDALIIGPFRMQFWVCGVFEIHDGRITLWRDYFDNVSLIKAVGRAILGAVVPSRRPTL